MKFNYKTVSRVLESKEVKDELLDILVGPKTFIPITTKEDHQTNIQNLLANHIEALLYLGELFMVTDDGKVPKEIKKKEMEDFMHEYLAYIRSLFFEIISTQDIQKKYGNLKKDEKLQV